jgi:hypothetical protein
VVLLRCWGSYTCPRSCLSCRPTCASACPHPRRCRGGSRFTDACVSTKTCCSTLTCTWTQGNARIELGDKVVICRGTHIVALAGIKIGDGSLIGEYTSIRDANHTRKSDQPIRDSGYSAKPITIGREVWLGRGVTVVGGVMIGDKATVGANADGTVVSIPAVTPSPEGPATSPHLLPRLYSRHGQYRHGSTGRRHAFVEGWKAYSMPSNREELANLFHGAAKEARDPIRPGASSKCVSECSATQHAYAHASPPRHNGI